MVQDRPEELISEPRLVCDPHVANEIDSELLAQVEEMHKPQPLSARQAAVAAGAGIA